MRKNNRESLRIPINKMCEMCIYDPIGGEGGKKQQIEACNSITCPLHPVRPRSTVISQKFGHNDLIITAASDDE